MSDRTRMSFLAFLSTWVPIFLILPFERFLLFYQMGLKLNKFKTYYKEPDTVICTHSYDCKNLGINK